MRLFLSAFAAAGLYALAGCGSSTVGTANTYVDVVGTVTLPDGQPLKRGMIYFEPEVPDKGRDDQAVVTGLAHVGDLKIMFIGHQKGKTLAERQATNFGCAHPEGYRKALRAMKMAAKFHLPVVCLIDTPGAYPGIGAEERGQASIIAENLLEMSLVDTPIVCVIIGEGGSGGALGIGIGDRVAMLEHAYYSVISPEGCATILWKGAEHAERAAAALRLTGKDLLAMKIIDEVIPEPTGGAHRDHREAGANLKSYIVRALREIQDAPRDQLLDRRYQKFRKIGVYFDEPAQPPDDAGPSVDA